LQRGFDLPTNQRVAGKFPLVTSSGPTDTHSEARVQGPGVVTGRSGSIGSVYFIGEDFWPLNTALYVKDFHGNDERYVFYLLQAFDLSRFSSGAGVPTLNRNHVHDELVLVASARAEQKRIVAKLDQAFATLDRARANAEANLADAREVFDRKLAQIFSGDQPGWKEKGLDEVCSITSALVDPREPNYINAIHVGAGNIESKTGNLSGLKTSREEQLVSGKFPFDGSMVLYSKIRPYLEKVARPNFSGVCSADMYPLAPIEGQITRDFLFWLLLSKPFTDYAIEGSARAGMPKVNREHLFQYETELPEIEEQQRIVANLDTLRREVSRMQAQYERDLSDLDALRQSLLQAAFSGQLS